MRWGSEKPFSCHHSLPSPSFSVPLSPALPFCPSPFSCTPLSQQKVCERCRFPQWGLGESPSHQQLCCICVLKCSKHFFTKIGLLQQFHKQVTKICTTFKLPKEAYSEHSGSVLDKARRQHTRPKKSQGGGNGVQFPIVLPHFNHWPCCAFQNINELHFGKISRGQGRHCTWLDT